MLQTSDQLTAVRANLTAIGMIRNGLMGLRSKLLWPVSGTFRACRLIISALAVDHIQTGETVALLFAFCNKFPMTVNDIGKHRFLKLCWIPAIALKVNEGEPELRLTSLQADSADNRICLAARKTAITFYTGIDRPYPAGLNHSSS